MSALIDRGLFVFTVNKKSDRHPSNVILKSPITPQSAKDAGIPKDLSFVFG
ncbi:hypothetical protein [Cyclobacterium jeungdonense]|uniref:Uncharacterized protein n=1 Tax=Cyclobacterium jeungdonense TaxID=708087 RepID=A0ABT8CBG0_9BACT|nr:hypothetical protein [Cyclobacterium jeungdonense]MDN3690144.1 hypothetical protein [Cyclobacterium jeungdonense]